MLDAYDKAFPHDKYNCLVCKEKFGTALKAIYHYVYTHNHTHCNPTLSPIMKQRALSETPDSADPQKPRTQYKCRESGCFKEGPFATYSKCKLIGHLAKYHKLISMCRLPVVITGVFEFNDIPFTEKFKAPPKSLTFESSRYYKLPFIYLIMMRSYQHIFASLQRPPDGSNTQDQRHLQLL